MELIVGVLASLVLFTIYWYLSRPSNLPPGPWGLPILGSILDTWYGPTCYPKLADWTKKYGSVYKMYIGTQLVVVLGDFDAIEEALVKQGDTFVGKPDFHGAQSKALRKLGLGNSEGELWRIQRRFAVHTLRDLGLGRPVLEPRIKDETERLIEAIATHDGAPFDIAPLMDSAAANVISSLIFSKRFEYGDQQLAQLLLSLRTRMAELKISFFAILALSQAAAKLIRFLPMIKKIRASGLAGIAFIEKQLPHALDGFRVEIDEPSNYVQAFYKARFESGGWTFFEEQLLASISSLFVAGTGTISSTLRWAIFYMCHYPEVQEAVHQEIVQRVGRRVAMFTYSDRSKLPLTEAVIKEVHRVCNLIPSLLRRTIAPCKLMGYDIPENSVVAPLIGDVLYDASVYPRPEKFDPNRFLLADKNGKEHERLVPFSLGKRNCPGVGLSRMEVHLFFVALFSTYKFCFSPDAPKPPLETKSALFRAPDGFMICAALRD